MKPLSQKFFSKSTLQVAKDLLGKYLVHETKEGKIVGKIVETEAYLQNDPACHASRGKTKRNAPMFGPPGNAYVYFTYGMYHCFNVSTKKENLGEAVLIRALEPIEGIDLMKKNRKLDKNLCNGPARLVIATGIGMHHNNHLMTNKPLYFASKGEKKPNIYTTTRIGISQGEDLPYRFYIKDNKFISKK